MARSGRPLSSPLTLGTIAGVLVLVLVAAGLGLRWWLDRAEDTALGEALGAVPASVQRVSFTDWARVRAEVGRGIGAGAPPGRIQDFLDRAFDADLVASSGLWEATETLDAAYGFSALDVASETLAQGRDGAVVALRLAAGADPTAIEDRLRDLRYDEPPAGAGTPGIWSADETRLALAGPSLSSLLLNVVVTDDWVLASDQVAFLDRAAGVIGDGDASLADAAVVDDLLGAMEGRSVLNAVLWPDDFVCEDLAMAQADPADAVVAEDVVARAGGVGPLAGALMARFDAREAVMALAYESADRAERDRDARLALAEGEAVGRSGTFAERFDATAVVDGRVVRLDLRLRRGAEGVLTELTRGPVLPATC